MNATLTARRRGSPLKKSSGDTPWPGNRYRKRFNLMTAFQTTVNNSNASRFAFIIDDEPDICRLLATTLAKLGIESATFSAARPAVAALYQRWPVIIFLDIALDQSDAYDVIRGLSEKHYGGTIQLMSGGRPWLLKSIQGLATRYALTLSPPLQKPVQGDAIRAVIERLGLTGTGPPLPDPDH